MEKLTLPVSVSIIIERLEKHGHEAYVVGGCVRDSIMGITPHDWDICTSAMPDEIIDVFADCKVIPTGLQHGTVTVVMDESEYEITTFRTDGEYKDNRHPESVQFVRNLEEDLMRRDFTINALAYNHSTGIIDFFNGIEDIKNKVVRCVGNPNDRFSEDALRILRAVRFAIRYGFLIEEETRKALLRFKQSLSNISVERINEELSKILVCDLTGKIALLYDLISLLSVPVPELNVLNTQSVCRRLIKSANLLEIRLALLFDFDTEILENVLKRLRFSNDDIKHTIIANKYGRFIRDDKNWKAAIDLNVPYIRYNKSGYFERKLVHDIRFEPAILAVEYAMVYTPEKSMDQIKLSVLRLRLYNVIDQKEPYRISDLKINGNDLMILGYTGKNIGKTLCAFLDIVMKDISLNDHDKLIGIAKSIKEYLI